MKSGFFTGIGLIFGQNCAKITDMYFKSRKNKFFELEKKI